MSEQHKVQAKVLTAYREIFLNTPQGKTILKDMMKASGLFAISGTTDTESLQHKEGAVDFVRRIIAILSLDEDQILKIALGHIDATEDENDG